MAAGDLEVETPFVAEVDLETAAEQYACAHGIVLLALELAFRTQGAKLMPFAVETGLGVELEKIQTRKDVGR